MPCYDSRNDPSYIRESFRHNSDVAELLCTACKTMADYPNHPFWTQAMHRWWGEHKKRDAAKAKHGKNAKRNAIMTVRQVHKAAGKLFREYGP